MKKRLTCVVAMLLPLFSLCQSTSFKPIALVAGDRMPDPVLHHVLNNPVSKIQLSSYANKVVLLDFFATWCGSCIAGLPRMDSLQRRFGEALQIVVVCYEPTATITKFLQTNSMVRGTVLPFVTADTLLKKWFPHEVLPHEVWINKDRTIAAITDAREVNEVNLQTFLQKGTPPLTSKKELMNLDTRRPLLEQSSSSASLIYQSTFLQYLPGVRSKNGVWWSADSSLQRHFFINAPLRSLYLKAIGYRLPPNRIWLELKDSSAFGVNGLNEEDWKQEHSYSYELTVRKNVSVVAWQLRMLADLNQAMGINGRVTKKMIPCLVLQRDSQRNITWESAGSKKRLQLPSAAQPEFLLQNQPLTVLVAHLNHSKDTGPLNPVVVDETGFTKPVDMRLAVKNLSDLAALRLALRPYGLELKEATRELEVLLLSEKQDH